MTTNEQKQNKLTFTFVVSLMDLDLSNRKKGKKRHSLSILVDLVYFKNVKSI